MVPLMSMLRHRQHYLETEKNRPVIFLVSVRSQDVLLYYDELRKISAQDPNFKLVITFTDMAPPGWDGFRRRVDDVMLQILYAEYTVSRVSCCRFLVKPFVDNVSQSAVDFIRKLFSLFFRPFDTCQLLSSSKS